MGAPVRTGSPHQVLLEDSHTLEAVDLQPGIIRENITTRGINVNDLAERLHWRGAMGSEHGMHAPRFAQKNTPGCGASYVADAACRAE